MKARGSGCQRPCGGKGVGENLSASEVAEVFPKEKNTWLFFEGKQVAKAGKIAGSDGEEKPATVFDKILDVVFYLALLAFLGWFLYKKVTA